MLREVAWPLAMALAILVAVQAWRRWSRLTTGYRELEEYADALLQHGQGTILNIQGIVSELSTDHPVRGRIELALSRAERDLAQFRDTMQGHCSERL